MPCWGTNNAAKADYHDDRTLHPAVKDFIRLLKARQVRRLVDVRTIPRSRHNPLFQPDRVIAGAALRPSSLHAHARTGRPPAPAPGFINAGWHNASFRGFADYMQTPEFRNDLDRLIWLAKAERTAIMCAQAAPWRCHCSLIGDALLARGRDSGKAGCLSR